MNSVFADIQFLHRSKAWSRHNRYIMAPIEDRFKLLGLTIVVQHSIFLQYHYPIVDVSPLVIQMYVYAISKRCVPLLANALQKQVVQ